MTKNQEPQLEEYFRDESDETGNQASVDDFLQQLEEREKDLHITADLSIEIEESELASPSLPDFVAKEVAGETSAKAAKTGQTNATEQRLKSEVAALKNQVAELKSERVKLVERNKQGLREFDNFKGRMDRERRETFVTQMSNLATSMLPVLDNLDRALDFSDDVREEMSDEFRQFYNGIVIVNQQIREVFAGMGVQPIATVGEPFDPEFHEAVAIDAVEGFAPNTVCEELLRGYRIGDRVIRHSMVKVVGVGFARNAAEPEQTEVPSIIDEPPNEPLPMLDDEVEELIASSYAEQADREPGK